MNDIDLLLDKLRNNCGILSNYHRKRYIGLKSRLKYYRIPIIVLSSLNSAFSVCLKGFMSQTYISLLNMFISLTVGIIGSIEMFYNYTKQIEQENAGARDFYILGCDIFKYLSLDRSHRVTEESIFLSESYTRYIKLIESSQLLKKRIDDRLTEITIPSVPPVVSTSSEGLFVDSSSEDNP
jgi:hypothetical protein